MRPPIAIAAALLPLALAGCVMHPAPEIATPTPDLPEAFFYTPDARTGSGLAALMPADDPAKCDAVERRSDRAGRVAHIFERMAAAAAVLDEHRFAARRIATCRGGGVRAELRAFVDRLVHYAGGRSRQQDSESQNDSAPSAKVPHRHPR